MYESWREAHVEERLRQAQLGGARSQGQTGDHSFAPIISGWAKETAGLPGLDEPYATRSVFRY